MHNVNYQQNIVRVISQSELHKIVVVSMAARLVPKSSQKSLDTQTLCSRRGL
jgi:hypothetical protein